MYVLRSILIRSVTLATLVWAWTAMPVSAATAQLTLLTWSDYLDPEVVTTFEERFGVKLNFVYFETDETRDDYLIATNGAGYDLIMVNGYGMQLYHQRGWLAPITHSDVPNIKHLDEAWLKPDVGMPGYGVPYFWGTLGIAYREDLVAAPPTRWMDLYAPAPELSGKIVMIKNSRDVIGMALRALGYSANSTDPHALAQVADLLRKQKPHVKTYSYLSLTEESSMVKGSVVAAQMYSGDALMLQEFSPHIKYVVPEEGTNLWVDFWTVAQASEHKALAYQFINFLNEPAIAAQLAEYMHYASPSKAANALLPASHHQDPIINPPDEVLEKGEYYRVLPPRVMRGWNNLFSEIVN